MGGDILLFDLKGKKFVLYFYLKDNMLGCMIEGLQFCDFYLKFKKVGVEVIGVLCDSLCLYDNFKVKFELLFLLIFDVDEVLCVLFDVIKMKKMYGKEVCGIECLMFLFDVDGVFCQVWCGIKVLGYVDDVLKVV